MSLAEPQFVGSYSECSGQIWVRSTIPGAQVTITDSTGATIAQGVAGWTEEFLTVTGSLFPGRSLFARQANAGDDSGPGTHGVAIGQAPTPAQLSAGTPLPAGMILGAESILVINAWPGSVVRIETGGQLSQPATVRPDGIAAVKLPVPLDSGNLRLIFDACGREEVNDVPVRLVEPKTAPTLVMEAPKACSRALSITKAPLGSVFTAQRTLQGSPTSSIGGITDPWPGTLTITGLPEFLASEQVDGEAGYPSTGFKVTATTTATPNPPNNLPNRDICAGETSVTLSNLEIGAEVHLESADWKITDSAAVPTQRFFFPPAVFGHDIKVTQRLCGAFTAAGGGWSAVPATVHVLSTAISSPIAVSPLDHAKHAPGTITLTWTDPHLNDRCSHASSFEVTISKDPSLVPVLQTLSTLGLSAGFSAPTPPSGSSQVYFWRVRAFNAFHAAPGMASAPIRSFTVQPNGVVGPPPPHPTTWCFCVSNPGFGPDHTTCVQATTQAEAEAKLNAPASAIWSPGPCPEG